MPKFILTVFEPTRERALAAVRDADSLVDGFEIRLDALDGSVASAEAFRGATPKELILTRRGRSFTTTEIENALAMGFDWIDVELGSEIPSSAANRIILSVHDFDGCPDPNALYHRMKAAGTAKRKIAVSPATFSDNERLLTTLSTASDGRFTAIGMGTRGLYSRLLAPFYGSELVFLARDEQSRAAPGQFTVDQARQIYGSANPEVPTTLFAVVGNPVSHSHSPKIHNALFREAGLPAAYSMIEARSFDEVGAAMTAQTAFAPTGISITAPFKEDAWRFAVNNGARLTDRASRSRAVNTLVRLDRQLVADNTDVIGFSAGMGTAALANRTAAVVGAGGAARAALVALQDAGVSGTIYNRNEEKSAELAREFGVGARPLAELPAFRGALIINALPADVEVDFPMFRGTYIDVSYGGMAEARADRARNAGMTVFDGTDFLNAQAKPQFELFRRAARETSGEPVTARSNQRLQR